MAAGDWGFFSCVESHSVAQCPKIQRMPIRHCASIAVILFASIAVAPQTITDLSKIEEIKDVVRTLVGGSEKAVVLLNDLAELDGYVTRRNTDSFEMKTDRKKRRGMKVRYMDVLAVSSKKASVSFVPDPKASPYGDWSHLGKIPPNALIEVTQRNGETRSGRYRSSAADHLVVAHIDKNDEWNIQRHDVAFVHRVKHGWRDISGGALGGAAKGQKVGKGVGQVLGGVRGPISGQPIGDGTGGLMPAIGAGIGAATGAAKGLTSKTEGLKVLVYSQ